MFSIPHNTDLRSYSMKTVLSLLEDVPILYAWLDLSLSVRATKGMDIMHLGLGFKQPNWPPYFTR